VLVLAFCRIFWPIGLSSYGLLKIQSDTNVGHDVIYRADQGRAEYEVDQLGHVRYVDLAVFVDIGRCILLDRVQDMVDDRGHVVDGERL